MPQVQRWYTGFSYRGNPQDLIKQISEQVQRHNLTKLVPILRVEKGIKSRKPFYFFLAIESHQVGQLPTELQASLLKLSFFQCPIKNSRGFTYEQIKPMVGVAHDVYDYTSPIPYQPRQNISTDNPFDFTELHSINHADADWVKPSQNSDRFLYWLSTLGNGSWESFQKSCNALQLEEPKRILRRLRLLGHLESSLDGSRWSAAPSAIVKINSYDTGFILCGQRSIGLIKQLEEYGIVASITPQPRGEAPPCIQLVVNNPDAIANNFPIINAGEVSTRLAQILPDIATWQQNLRNMPGIVPSRWEWKHFDGDDFEICGIPHETGMYQMCDENRNLRYTLFYNQNTNTWHQGDWYGLRFLALYYHGASCQAHYNFATKCLAIPVKQRWPELYERALVLASGQLPTYQGKWLLYQNVSGEVAHQLSQKLNVKYEEALICA
ncbi:MAG: hypothetical protein V7K41_25160 [Nostoc sp.]|uniref:hypothetical protein n=1 Tax=Nostoc sp. TaxID=1180 RepID=UPI002FF70539